MTIITLGNLPTFKFIVVDTHSCIRIEMNDQLELDKNVNKLYYSDKENISLTLAGSGQLYDLITEFPNIEYGKISRDSKYRESILSFVNMKLKLRKPSEPQNSKLFIMSKDQMVRWLIQYDNDDKEYFQWDNPIILTPENSIYMVCFGNEIEHKIDIDSLNHDNFEKKVYDKMKAVYRNCIKDDQRLFNLPDIDYYSSAYLLKDTGITTLNLYKPSNTTV